jgi:hypothetical protein
LDDGGDGIVGPSPRCGPSWPCPPVSTGVDPEATPEFSATTTTPEAGKLTPPHDCAAQGDGDNAIAEALADCFIDINGCIYSTICADSIANCTELLIRLLALPVPKGVAVPKSWEEFLKYIIEEEAPKPEAIGSDEKP